MQNAKFALCSGYSELTTEGANHLYYMFICTSKNGIRHLKTMIA